MGWEYILTFLAWMWPASEGSVALLSGDRRAQWSIETEHLKAERTLGNFQTSVSQTCPQSPEVDRGMGIACPFPPPSASATELLMYWAHMRFVELLKKFSSKVVNQWFKPVSTLRVKQRKFNCTEVQKGSGMLLLTGQPGCLPCAWCAPIPAPSQVEEGMEGWTPTLILNLMLFTASSEEVG